MNKTLKHTDQTAEALRLYDVLFTHGETHTHMNVYIIFEINHLKGQCILHKVALIKLLNARYHVFQNFCG